MGKSRNTDKYGKFRNRGNNKPRKNKENSTRTRDDMKQSDPYDRSIGGPNDYAYGM